VVEVAEGVVHEVGQAADADLHEDAGAGLVVEPLDQRAEAHRLHQVPQVEVDDLGPGRRIRRHVGGRPHGRGRRLDGQGRQDGPEGAQRLLHERGVEPRLDGEAVAEDPGVAQAGQGGLDDARWSADHRLAGAVVVGDDHALDVGHDRFDGGDAGRQGGEVEVGEVDGVEVDAADQLARVGVGDDAGRHRPAPLADAVAGNDVGLDSYLAQGQVEEDAQVVDRGAAVGQRVVGDRRGLEAEPGGQSRQVGLIGPEGRLDAGEEEDHLAGGGGVGPGSAGLGQAGGREPDVAPAPPGLSLGHHASSQPDLALVGIDDPEAERSLAGPDEPGLGWLVG
jgi:hypothetical protein